MLTYGANKYAPNNWLRVKQLNRRYLDAALRHLNDYQTGELRDEESGCLSLAHAITDLMFILEFYLRKGPLYGRPE